MAASRGRSSPWRRFCRSTSTVSGSSGREACSLVAIAIHAHRRCAITPINRRAPVFFIYAAAFLGIGVPPRVAVRWLLVMLAVTMLAEGLDCRTGRSGRGRRFWLVGGVVGVTNIHFAEIRRRNSAAARGAGGGRGDGAHCRTRAYRARPARPAGPHAVSSSCSRLNSPRSSPIGTLPVLSAEIRDVERIARDALVEVRKAVRGYRSDTPGATRSPTPNACSCAAGVAATIDLGRINR